MDGILKVIDMLGHTISQLQAEIAQAREIIARQQAQIDAFHQPKEEPDASEA